MKITLESNNLKDYLGESRGVDWSHLLIREKVEELYEGCDSELDKVRRAFEFVRDEIAHS
nr:hypothetical protein [Halonatronum saccharophilum]